MADFVAAVIPEGQQHDDALAIYAAGTRAAAEVVRLQDVLAQPPPAAPTVAAKPA